ncbi:MAG: T9SS type A sorting domain-containing protein [Bacteroidetes bacterium]|nr:T9SS type A sorting domain-containing protein [Bacteroidota bacterium]
MRLFLTILVLLSLQLHALSQQQCTSTEYRQQLFNRVAGFSSKAAAIEMFTRRFIDKKTTTSDTASSSAVPEIITIPVVVHVVYHSSSQNISDAQVLSQIDVLNKDYRRQNADAVNTPEVFRNVAADCGIRFELATVDPNGNPTSGIIHKNTNILGFNISDDVKFSANGGDDGWNPDHYLNIWVTNLSSGVLGYASIPGSPKDKDGVVIQYTAFGTNGTATAPFNRGRTTTHEVGHWLNLFHTWGDADCGDDEVADTPPQRAANRGCPNTIRVTCGNGPLGDMYMNFMDFTDDACMNLFTNGQRERMRSLFASGGVRNAMLSSVAANGRSNSPLQSGIIEESNNFIVKVYPNPATSAVFVQTSSKDNTSNSMLNVYNEMGQRVMTVKLTQQVQQLNISLLKSGIYYLKSDDGKNNTVTKLVKF